MKPILNFLTYKTFIVVIFLFAVALAPSITKKTGDGLEYILYARAIKTHFSVNIQDDDIDYAIKDKNINTSLKNQLFETELYQNLPWATPIGNNAYYINPGFVKSNSGKVYTWHFWLYPTFVAPFLVITDFLNLKPASAFWFCNWFLVLATLGYIGSLWKASDWQKISLAAGFLLSGTSYYIKWTHPEVFTASFMLLGLMSFFDKRYKLSLLAIAISATQNPPILLLLIIIITFILYNFIIIIKNTNLLKALKIESANLFFIVLSVFIAIYPMVFYYSTIGVFNPIASMGVANLSLISIERLISIYFDLNMGMILGTLGIFMAALYTFFCYKNINESAKPMSYLKYSTPIILGSMVSILMALPALSTANWNHGCNIINRYAYWLAIPILFGLVLNLGSLNKKTQIRIAILLIVIQTMIVVNNHVFGKPSTTKFKPLAKFVMKKFPSIYNPIPEVFIERFNRKEGMPNLDGTDNLIFMFPNNEKPTKILAHQTQLKLLENKLPATCIYNKSASVEGGWVYLNLDSCQ